MKKLILISALLFSSFINILPAAVTADDMVAEEINGILARRDTSPLNPQEQRLIEQLKSNIAKVSVLSRKAFMVRAPTLASPVVIFRAKEVIMLCIKK